MAIVESRYGANEILKFVSYNVHDRKIKLDNRKLEKKLKKVEKYYNDINRANNRRKANQEISSGLLTRNKQPPTLFEPWDHVDSNLVATVRRWLPPLASPVSIERSPKKI